jgi:hypothetical protein
MLRPRAVFTSLQRRLHLEEAANAFPDLGYLGYPIRLTVSSGAGILTGFASTTPFGLVLAPD